MSKGSTGNSLLHELWALIVAVLKIFVLVFIGLCKISSWILTKVAEGFEKIIGK